MDEWNAAVDEYISSGVDMRMREDIENESKIGLGGGPLHARCENEICNEPHEGRTDYDGLSPTKLLLCTGCKKVGGLLESSMKFIVLNSSSSSFCRQSIVQRNASANRGRRTNKRASRGRCRNSC